MFINGQQVDLDVYDVFTLLDNMRAEATLMEGLHALGIQGPNMNSLLKLDLRDTDSNYAVDMRDKSIVVSA
jgi:UDP-glucose:glycoprotein glucosyltransferase